MTTSRLLLPEPIGLQPSWLDSPATRKVLRVGRRGSKTRFNLIASLTGHGPGWREGKPTMPGVTQGTRSRPRDVVWIAQTYGNLSTVLWREEIVPRCGDLPWVKLDTQHHDVHFEGHGSLLLRSGDREAIQSVRGIGKRLAGVIVDEAAWLDLRGALLDIILPALMDNEGWLIVSSTTNAGQDGGYQDSGAPQLPSYFNVICQEIRSGKRSKEWVEFTGTAYDNPEMSKSAIDELVREYAPDSPKLKQEVFVELLESGVGLALPGLSEATHLVPAFSPPAHWNSWLSFDWGYHHPWALCHFVIDEDGQVYQRDGLMGRMDLPEQLDAKVRQAGLHPERMPVYAGPDVWRTRVSEKGKIQGQFLGPTVAEELQRLGWQLIPAADARVAGLNNIRRYTYIPPDRPGARPRFVWMDTPNNRAALAQFQRMPLDPDNPEDALKVNADAAGRGGDDWYDCGRYGLMARPILSMAVLPTAEEGVSLGYDYDRHAPRERQTGDSLMAAWIGEGRESARVGRYGVPPRRGR